jgi:hypothetical protein
MKIKIEEVPNEAILYFHVDRKVSPELVVDAGSVESIKEEWDIMDTGKQPPETLVALATALFEILGVTSLGFDKYEIVVEKAEVFEWEDIEPKVVEVIKAQFLKEGEEVKEMPRKVCTEEDRAINDQQINRMDNDDLGYRSIGDTE